MADVSSYAYQKTTKTVTRTNITELEKSYYDNEFEYVNLISMMGGLVGSVGYSSDLKHIQYWNGGSDTSVWEDNTGRYHGDYYGFIRGIEYDYTKNDYKSYAGGIAGYATQCNECYSNCSKITGGFSMSTRYFTSFFNKSFSYTKHRYNYSRWNIYINKLQC